MNRKAKRVEEEQFKKAYEAWMGRSSKVKEIVSSLGLSEGAFYRRTKDYKAYIEGTRHKPHWLI